MKIRRLLEAPMALLTFTALMLNHAALAADKYIGRCDVVFEGDATLHSFSGCITNMTLVVWADTNAANEEVLNTRIEIKPRQLTTRQKSRDAKMYEMFKEDRFPKLIVAVSHAPFADAKLSPSGTPSGPGVLPVQLNICGISNEVQAYTTNPINLAEGWEFDLETVVSLKAFKLEPPSAMFGVITVKDGVKVKAHVKVIKEPPKS